MKYNQQTIRYVSLGLLLLAIVILVIFNESLIVFISGFLSRYGYLAFTVLAGILEGIPQLLSTDLLLLMGEIFQFNSYYILLCVIVGSTVGSIIAFFLGQKFGKKFVLYFITEKKYSETTDRLRKLGKYALPIISILPLPFFPLVFGATRISFIDFVVYGLTIRVLKHAMTSYLIVYLSQHDYLYYLTGWFGL